jgi:WD40 repeat protein
MRRQWYAASSNAMQQAWDTGQLGRLRALLAETEAYPDRGFEWYYCQRLCHLERHTFIGHRAGVTAVSWSPDGKWLATASEDGTAKTWEARSGREPLTLQGHMSQVRSVSWSPDGKRLATGSQDGTAKVWEAATTEAVQEWAHQDRTLEKLLALNAYRGPHAKGFIQRWLLLLPFPYSGESGEQALDQQQLGAEAQLRPRPGQSVRIGDKELVWQEYRSPEAVLDFNALLGQVK